MLPRADLSSIRPVLAIDAPSAVVTIADAKHEAVGRLAQIALGQQVQAKVLSALEDGTFLVRVAGATARMNLPVDAKVGQSLLLTLTSTTPRPTFLLGNDANPAATANVSATGRLIDHLLQSARQGNAPATLQGSAPLLKAPPTASTPLPQPAQMASVLREAVVYSGLFYESHVAQWAAGTRSLAQLLREPQAQDFMLPDAKLPGAARAEAAPSQQLIPLQLDTLENQRVLWRGELWPGQPLEWEISKDAPQGGDPAAAEAEPSWHSVVCFELPLLGKVSGAIRLVGQRLHMQLRTETEAAALALRAHGAELSDALSAAGSPLDSLTVKRDAAEP
ncbi:MAG TPA: flagellar hook-length control protein FliK [Burkholderiaceae bacterium]|nr:flagellar hook-length control protein FliK [Burkholderiaceae bacterium]